MGAGRAVMDRRYDPLDDKSASPVAACPRDLDAKIIPALGPMTASALTPALGPTGMPTLTPSTKTARTHTYGLLRIILTAAVHDELSRLTRAGSPLPALSRGPRPSARPR